MLSFDFSNGIESVWISLRFQFRTIFYQMEDVTKWASSLLVLTVLAEITKVQKMESWRHTLIKRRLNKL